MKLEALCGSVSIIGCCCDLLLRVLGLVISNYLTKQWANVFFPAIKMVSFPHGLGGEEVIGSSRANNIFSNLVLLRISVVVHRPLVLGRVVVAIAFWSPLGLPRIWNPYVHAQEMVNMPDCPLLHPF